MYLKGCYECSCNNGFNGDDVTCSDIDECVTVDNSYDQNTQCTNTVGSYKCSCTDGYDGDGYQCDDIDECVSNLDNCHERFGICKKNEGSLTSSCEAGTPVTVLTALILMNVSGILICATQMLNAKTVMLDIHVNVTLDIPVMAKHVLISTNVLPVSHHVTSMQPVSTKKEVTCVHVIQVSMALVMLAMLLTNTKTNHVTQMVIAKTLSSHSNALVKMGFRVMD